MYTTAVCVSETAFIISQNQLMSSCCRINHTVILDDPFDDPPDLPVPDRSPEPTKEQLDVSADMSNVRI